jgi:membrane protein DedA with SNARE-associated domain
MSFEQILHFVQSQNEFIIYGILLVSAFIENIFPPFPGDTITLAGAYLAGEGNIAYIGVLVSVVAGGIAGAMTLYVIGKAAGRQYFETGRGRYLTRGSLVKIERMFDKYGSAIILSSRFITGIRSAIAVTAGIVRYDIYRMAILTTISFVLWTGTLMGLMVYFKSNWRAIAHLVRHFNAVILVLGALLLLGWIIRILWKRNTKSQS